MFEVLFAESGLRAIPESFASASEAQAAAVAKRNETGLVTRIKRIATEGWREREASRLASGEYKTLPPWWLESAWWNGSEASRDHYAHESAGSPGLIAYTASAEKGASNTQTPIKVSTYLAKYFGNVMTPPMIGEISRRFAGETKAGIMVHFSKCPDQFEKVYDGQTVYPEHANVPSCMAKTKERFGLPVHPARVYGAGDLAIAWTQDDSAEEFTVTSRAVVWPERKQYVRIYGRRDADKLALATALEAQGFERHDLEGARLLRIEYCGALLLPYLDGCKAATDDGRGFLVLDSDGEYSGEQTNGYAESVSRYSCDNCGEGCDEDDTYTVDNDTWCRGCYENSAFTCERCHEGTRDSDSHRVIGRRGYESAWCSGCVENGDTFTCESSGDTYDSRYHDSVDVRTHARRDYTETWLADGEGYFICERDETAYSDSVFTAIEVRTHGGTETWCSEESDSEYFTCEDCGENFASDMMHETREGLCLDCGDTAAESAASLAQDAARRATLRQRRVAC
jgi:hypothetical protein